MFSTRFTLRFRQTKVDTCSACEALNVKIQSKLLNEKVKQVAVVEELVHLRRANKFYAKLKAL